MKKSTIAAIHFMAFLLLSVLFCFVSESLLKIIAPGFYDVGMWIVLLISGIILIFILSLASFIITIKKLKRKQ